MDALAILLKLGHVALAFILVAGLLGRWVLLTRAARSDDVEQVHLLAESVSPFERAVQVSSPVLAGLGLATAWAQGYPWLGLTTGWMLLTVALIIPILLLIPTVFVPRGQVFEAEMAAARAAGHVTPGLRAAWNDRATAMARRYELAAIAIIVVLMVFKPF
jgi:ABC-type transport system involved in cytochrome bd biosynthesis fused ATPase/permease subunit